MVYLLGAQSVGTYARIFADWDNLQLLTKFITEVT